MNSLNTPAEIVEANIKAGKKKAELPLIRMALLGILAGAIIALGGSASSVAAHNMENVGIARLLTAVVFPVGLMMIVLTGGELFTGNCMITMAVLDGQTTTMKKVRNLVIVYFANLVGALVIDLLVFASGQLNYSEGGLGAYSIKVAIGKMDMLFVEGVASGILCNILVCTAILMASAANDVTGKIWAMFFPIFAFVIGGFEHSIANMFYIPIGMFAASNPAYVAKAAELYGITEQQCSQMTIGQSLHNFVPVTIGNIIGGVFFVSVMYYLVHRKQWDKTSEI